MIIEQAKIEVRNWDNIVGRFFNYSFADFSLDQIDILNTILLTETQCVSYSIDYPIATIECGYSHLVNLANSVETIVYHEELEKSISIIYSINWKDKEISGYVFVKTDKKDIIDRKHIVQDALKIARLLSDYIRSLLNNINDVVVSSNFFLQKVALWDGDFSGMYDFGKVRVDFGIPQPDRKDYKVVLCEMQFNQYQLKNGYHPTFSFIERRSTILLTLLQLFLRTPFYDLDLKTQLLSDRIAGPVVNTSREDYSNEYITDKINNSVIPADVEFLIDCFDNLPIDYQDAFVNSALMYVKGLKQRNNQLQATAYFVIALETLSNITPHTSKEKVEGIMELINGIFQRPIEKEYVELCYKIRCAYVHDGQSNECLINNIFFKYIVNDDFSDYIERLTNFTLVGWLNGFARTETQQ